MLCSSSQQRSSGRQPHISKVVLAVTLLLGTAVILLPAGRLHAQSGCCTVRGNVDCDAGGGVDIADLSRLIDYMLISFDPLCCPEAGNVDGSIDSIIDISDLSRLIDFMLISFAPLEPCWGTELTFEERTVLFDALDSVYNALLGQPQDTFAINLAAFLSSRPEIDSAEVVDSVNVSAWFTDGRLLSIPAGKTMGGSASGSAHDLPQAMSSDLPKGFVMPKRRFPSLSDPTWLPTAPQMVSSAANRELPSSIQATLISNFTTTCNTVSVPTIKALLDNHGYVTNVVTGSVANLLNIHDDGIFYIDTHGGPGQDWNGNKYMAIWTATQLSAQNELAFNSMLARHELVYMFQHEYDAQAMTCRPHRRYGFTGKFVAQYMYFAPNSFVFVNACQSDSVPSIRNGFFTAGASTYCGFTKTVSFPGSNRMAEYVFDRMLGANASIWSPKESPKQRPFDIDLIYADMVSRQLDIDKDDPARARLRVEHLQNQMGILAPSIRYMAVIEHFDTLYITGMFGTDPGPSKRRVLVGGTDMLVYIWQPQLITCFIPNTGAGSVGPVTVEIDGLTGPSSSIKRKSNVVNLTEWNGQFTYTHDDFDSLQKKIVIDTRLRADIHSFRDKPHETPKYYSVIFPAKEDSYGTATVSGTASYTWPDSDPVNTTTWTWHGTHALKGLWENDPTGFLLTGYVDGNLHQFRLHVVAAEHRDLYETITSSGGGSDTYGISVSIPFEIYDTPPGYFYIQMNSVWNILGGSRTINTCCSRNPANDTGVDDIVQTFSWPTIPASWAPDPTAGQ